MPSENAGAKSTHPVGTIDLNADIGEGYGVWAIGCDAQLMSEISSANIAAGYHAGDATTLRVSTSLAATSSVSIGAHVSYPDRIGFGRRYVDMAFSELVDAILHQLGAVATFAGVAGSELKYVKPHGALYNTENRAHAEAVNLAIDEFGSKLPLLCLEGTALFQCAQNSDHEVYLEAFPDRQYAPEGLLLGRSIAGSVITDPHVVADRAIKMVIDRSVETADGSVRELSADSICIHGDNPNSAAVAHTVRTTLVHAGISVHPFVS